MKDFNSLQPLAAGGDDWGDRLPELRLDANVPRWVRPVGGFKIGGRHWMRIFGKGANKTPMIPYNCAGVDEQTEAFLSPEQNPCLSCKEPDLTNRSLGYYVVVIDKVALDNGGVVLDPTRGGPLMREGKPVLDPIIKVAFLSTALMRQIKELAKQPVSPAPGAYIPGDPTNLQTGCLIELTKNVTKVATKKGGMVDRTRYSARFDIQPFPVPAEWLAQQDIPDLDKRVVGATLEQQRALVGKCAEEPVKQALSYHLNQMLPPEARTQVPSAPFAPANPGMGNQRPGFPTAPGFPAASGLPGQGFGSATPAMPSVAGTSGAVPGFGSSTPGFSAPGATGSGFSGFPGQSPMPSAPAAQQDLMAKLREYEAQLGIKAPVVGASGQGLVSPGVQPHAPAQSTMFPPVAAVSDRPGTAPFGTPPAADTASAQPEVQSDPVTGEILPDGAPADDVPY